MAQSSSNEAPIHNTDISTRHWHYFPGELVDLSIHTQQPVPDPRVSKVEAIARRCLKVKSMVAVRAIHLGTPPKTPLAAQSSFKVTVEDKEYILSVKEHEDRGRGVASQVASMDCIRRHTDIQVPEVIAYDETDNNELGRAWILREYLHGEPLEYRWRALSTEEKQDVVQSLARYLAQLHRIRFDKIGSLVYHKSADTPKPVRPTSLRSWFLEVVMRLTIWSAVAYLYHVASSLSARLTPTKPLPKKEREIIVGPDSTITYPGLETGPFSTAYDWILVRLQQATRTAMIIANTPGQDIEKPIDLIGECFTWRQHFYTRRRKSLGRVEPSGSATSIYHPIRATTVLISDTGKLAGFTNWDEVAVWPYWAVTSVPDALVSRELLEMPTLDQFINSDLLEDKPVESRDCIMEAYAKSHARLAITQSTRDFDKYPDDAHVRQFWNRLEEYEKTKLRDYFLDQMKVLEPNWIETRVKRKRKRSIARMMDDLVNQIFVMCGDWLYAEYFDPEVVVETSEDEWEGDDETVAGDSEEEEEPESDDEAGNDAEPEATPAAEGDAVARPDVVDGDGEDEPKVDPVTNDVAERDGAGDQGDQPETGAVVDDTAEGDGAGVDGDQPAAEPADDDSDDDSDDSSQADSLELSDVE